MVLKLRLYHNLTSWLLNFSIWCTYRRTHTPPLTHAHVHTHTHTHTHTYTHTHQYMYTGDNLTALIFMYTYDFPIFIDHNLQMGIVSLILEGVLTPASFEAVTTKLKVSHSMASSSWRIAKVIEVFTELCVTFRLVILVCSTM